jgi:lipid-A-disaccharide synthase
MKIYFITGEPSGDLLASSLMKALTEKVSDVEFYGVGGETMKSYGFTSLFNMEDLTVMGFVEVLPRLPLILTRVKQTLADIETVQPDIIITVDSWGFVSTLLSRLKRKHVNIPKLHYVAPQVWAWKKGRAKNVAMLVDRLMTLLPNEPKYFERYGLRCEFVGHPVVENRIESIDGSNFRKKYNILHNANILTVLPGSRNSEIRRLIPVFKDVIRILSSRIDRLVVVIPTVEALFDKVRQMFDGFDVPTCIVTGRDERYAAFKTSWAAIAASGTVSLELASCHTPHIVAYRFNAVTNFLADILVTVKYANLINLLCDREIIPEFMLDKCRADLIAAKILELTNETTVKAMIDEMNIGLRKLCLPDVLPSQKAAETVIEMIADRQRSNV